MSTYTPPRTTEALRYVAEYQIFTDGDPRTVVTEMLTKGVEDGHLKGFAVNAVYPGFMGLTLVQFTADVPITDWHHRLDRDGLKESGVTTLNGVIGDSDVEVRWWLVVDYVNLRHPDACAWCDRRVLNTDACPNSPDICHDCCGDD